MLVKALKWWDEFWFKDISPYPLAAFRILFGIYLLFYLGSFMVSFSNLGVYVPYRIPDIVPGPAGAYLIYCSTLGLIVAFIIGFKTRLVTPLLFIFYLYHYLINLAVKNHSYDRVTMCLLAVLCFAEVDRVWSASNVYRKKLSQNIMIMGWAQRFICVFLCVLYFGMSAYKLTNPNWHSGIMLEMNMYGEWGTPVAYWIVSLGLPMWVFTGMAFSTIVLEMVLAWTLFVKPLHKFVFPLGILFHLSIYLIFNIPEFLFMPMLYILFVDGALVCKIGDKLGLILKLLTKSLMKFNLA